MTTPPVRSPWLRAAGFGAVAAALAVAACETPGPVQPAPVDAERVYAAPGAKEGLQPAALTPRQALERYYPDVLANGIGAAGGHVMFVLSPAGEVVHHRLERRDPAAARAEAEAIARGESLPRTPLRVEPAPGGRELDPDEIESVDVMKFRAGQMGPDALDVLWVRLGEPGQVAARSMARVPGGVERHPMRTRRGGEGDGELRTVRTLGGGPEPVDPEQFARLVQENVPQVVSRGGVDGQVTVRFTAADGRAKDPAVVGTPHPDVAAAALRVVNALELEPGLSRSNPGQVVTVSIDFATPPKVSGGSRPRTAAPRQPGIPAAPNALIAGTLKAHYPEVAQGRGEEQYWFVIDGQGRIADTGKGSIPAAVRGIDPNRIDEVQVEDVEVGGHTAHVLWIRLKA